MDVQLEIRPLEVEGVMVEGLRWGSQADALNRQRTAASIQSVISTEQIERFLQASAGGGWHQHGLGPNAQASVAYGNRFGDLGLVLRGSFRRNDMMMDDIRYFWGTEDFGNGGVDVLNQLRLGSYQTERDRWALSGRADYNVSDQTTLIVRGLFNYFDKHGTRHQFRVRPESGDHLAFGVVEGGRLETIGRQNRRTQFLSTLGVGMEAVAGPFNVDANVSGGFGRHKQPYQRYLNHRLGGVDLAYDISNTRRAEWEVMNGPENQAFDPARIPFLRHEDRTDDVQDRDFNARMNFELPYRAAGAQGSFQFGGRFFQKEKDREFWVRRFFPDRDDRGRWMLSDLNGNGEHRALLGRYRIGHSVDWGRGMQFLEENFHLLEEDVDRTFEICASQNYEASESVTAGYAMTTLDWGAWTLLGGVRLERTANSYVGKQTLFDEDGSFVEMNPIDRGNSYVNVFPSAHLRYRASDRTNFRLAWTNALARPNFTDLAPTEFIDGDAPRITRGNPELEPSLVQNVDLLAEHYFEPLGLLSGGVFCKRLTDFFFGSVDRIQGGALDGFEVLQPRNGASADLWGAEIAW